MWNTNQVSIESRIVDFYNDPLFQKLNAYYSKKTLFNILKIERNENRHSAFLAWLLDVKESHGLGDEPLKRFMRLLYLKSEENRYDSCFLLGNYLIDKLEVSTEKYAEHDEENGRIDVYFEFDYRYKEGDNDAKRLCVIIENKMFTKEHGKQTALYRDWALKTFDKKDIVGVFLAPNRVDKCSGDMESFKFLKIDYQDLLDYVLEPLLLFDLPQEARSIIQDYVINLEQPLENEPSEKGGKKKASSKDTYKDTILAASKTKQEQFLRLYGNHPSLLDSALIANCLNKKKKDLTVVYGNDWRLNEDAQKPILYHFWTSNEMLFRMIMNVELLNRDRDDEGYQQAVNNLLGLKESNRDNTRYLVYAKDGTLLNDNGKPVPKSLASFFIFKAWLCNHTGATLSEIREAFPVNVCAPHYNEVYKYLFYEYDEKHIIKPAEDEPGKKQYLDWAFFKDTTCHLELKDAPIVMSVKKWQKKGFDDLIKYVEPMGIKVIAH